MNYLKVYHKLCNSRKEMSRAKGNGVYYEEHHITPRWLGGSDELSNLVLLTAREHYIAHYLLFRHYKDRSSSAAFAIMNTTVNNKYRDSKKYEELRLLQAELLTGKRNPAKRADVRKKISLKISGKLNGMYGRNGNANPFYGKTHTTEFREYKRKLHGKKLKFRGVVYESERHCEKLTGVSRYILKKECTYLNK